MIDTAARDEAPDTDGVGDWLAALPERERLVVFLR
jgi:hypothetical protein